MNKDGIILDRSRQNVSTLQHFIYFLPTFQVVRFREILEDDPLWATTVPPDIQVTLTDDGNIGRKTMTYHHLRKTHL